jgi:hypothetical protein
MGTHEQKDVNVRNLLLLGSGMGFLTLLGLVGMGLLFAYYSTHESLGPPPSPLAAGPQIPPQPRLEIGEHSDLERKRRAEEAILNTYGWVDRKAGIVRIPIDRAIELLAQRGLPARAQNTEKER